MDQCARLVERYFESRGGELVIGGVPVSDLANQYGTPLFVYDRSVLERKWDMLRAVLPPEFSICYSVKANPSQAILQCFLSKGAGLEIASGGEYLQARSAGCPAEKIIFAGPGKTEDELKLVLKEGIGEIHIESLREAGRIAAIAEQCGIRASVSLRVNPSDEAEGGAMRMGGRPAPFGVDEETLDKALDELLSLSALAFRGIHLFSGTQILDARILASQYRKGLEIARRVATRLNRPLDTLDFGGGLGITYFPHEQELDIESFGAAIASLMEGIRTDPLFEGTRLLCRAGTISGGGGRCLRDPNK